MSIPQVVGGVTGLDNKPLAEWRTLHLCTSLMCMCVGVYDKGLQTKGMTHAEPGLCESREG